MEEVYKFDKNALETVRVILNKFKGRDVVDFRVYYKDNVTDKEMPTRKGICLSVEKLPELRKALEKAEKEIKRANTVKDS